MNRQESDGYILRTAVPAEADEIYECLMRVWRGLENKELYSVGGLSPAWVRAMLEGGGFGVTARTPEGELAGAFVAVFPGTDPDNLGYDIGMPQDQLSKVCNMDTAAVLPAHRGHALEYRMLRYGEEQLAGTPIRWLLATISPRNPASLKSGLRAGYTVVATREKYGGLLRHIVCKPINGASLSELPPIPTQTE